MAPVTLTTRDAAVLVLLLRSPPSATRRVVMQRLQGPARQIARNLLGEKCGRACVRKAAAELRRLAVYLKRSE